MDTQCVEFPAVPELNRILNSWNTNHDFPDDVACRTASEILDIAFKNWVLDLQLRKDNPFPIFKEQCHTLDPQGIRQCYVQYTTKLSTMDFWQNYSVRFQQAIIKELKQQCPPGYEVQIVKHGILVLSYLGKQKEN